MNPKGTPTNDQHLVTTDPDLIKILDARHHDPFSILGRHTTKKGEIFRVFLPDAETVTIGKKGPNMERLAGSDLFQLTTKKGAIPKQTEIHWVDKKGDNRSHFDPYTFPPQISEFDLHLFGEGKHWHIYRILGAHVHNVDGIEGVLFSTWAPNAERASVVGNFNQWDGRCHPMRSLGGTGVWELFIPGIAIGEMYKFEIRNRQSGDIMLKTDPYGREFELRPNTSSIVRQENNYAWSDEKWIKKRGKQDWLHTPMSIYEVHLGSWQRDKNNDFLNYRELAKQLVAHTKAMGFTHIELMPVTEHPLDASWGYQTTGYFAPTRRFGDPDDFHYFVDYCHQNDIGVLLDWVPAHFPKDAHGLAHYDGTALYEHEDPRMREHLDWGTHIYNYGRNEVKNFLLASALFWLEEYHLDGLRVDAVASMLYLDYSREEGQWVANKYGGNENLEAIDFFRELNTVTHEQQPGTLIIAEESTAWPQVTRPTWTGGLGFTMKWNMGWMHDTLSYMSKEPVYRHYHHDQLTFGLLYAFSENFVLPFSHDEVVHGKNSMLYKMPGDEWQRFANLRLLYTFMFTYPGKKLLFMGCEFAQGDEWNHDKALDWYVLDYDYHKGIKTLITDLNRINQNTLPLYQHDFEEKGFEWIDCHDTSQSILGYMRKSDDSFAIVLLNFTPIPREGYRIGVPVGGEYEEILNSDSEYYFGSNIGNNIIQADDTPWMNHPHSITLTLPPLAGIVLTPRKKVVEKKKIGKSSSQTKKKS